MADWWTDGCMKRRIGINSFFTHSLTFWKKKANNLSLSEVMYKFCLYYYHLLVTESNGESLEWALRHHFKDTLIFCISMSELWNVLMIPWSMVIVCSKQTVPSHAHGADDCKVIISQHGGHHSQMIMVSLYNSLSDKKHFISCSVRFWRSCCLVWYGQHFISSLSLLKAKNVTNLNLLKTEVHLTFNNMDSTSKNTHCTSVTDKISSMVLE